MVPEPFVNNIVYIVALAQTAVAPLAFVYYIYYIATERPLFITGYAATDALLHYWLGCELIFYVFFQITRSRMQQTLPAVYPGPKERRSLYYNCISNIDDVDEWLTGWFMKNNNPSQHPKLCEIRRENLAEWIAWAFFAQSMETLFEDEASMKEMYWMIDDFSQRFKVNFLPGYDDDIVAFRLTLDPVQAYHRPFAFYLFIFALTYVNGIIMRAWGFKKHGAEIQSSLSFWWNDAANPERSERICYWFRDGDRSKKPIVFVHGIGPGLLLYLRLVYQLVALGAPVFCVELPYVAMRCVEDVPTMQETVRDVERMLQHHGCNDAVFVAHSLGTAITSWMIKHIPKVVSGIVMLDPITFLLHYKDVCFNFVYRLPATASQSIVKYFASSELYISYYIGRHFHWFQMALYVTARHGNNQHTTAMPSKTRVFLSELDNIVHSPRVHKYLTKNGIDSVLMHGMDHGWFLLRSAWLEQIIGTVAEYISN